MGLSEYLYFHNGLNATSPQIHSHTKRQRKFNKIYQNFIAVVLLNLNEKITVWILSEYQMGLLMYKNGEKSKRNVTIQNGKINE